jgi:hypothetical protein
MRRSVNVVSVLLVLASVMLVLSAGSMVAQDTFPTNTPIVFATNTLFPTEATDPPTNSPTPSLTPSPSPTATLTPSLTPSPTPTPMGPSEYPDGWNPLTGLPYSSEEAMNRRNLIVKISNYPPIVRPQSGVNQADVVYEYEVEGGVTRFAAIYRDNAPTHVGPIRSGRLTDLELAPMYNALLAYSGASEPIHRAILASEWGRWGAITPARGDNCEEAGFCRFPNGDLAFEHTLYLDTNKAWERATFRGVNEGRRARGFAFGIETPPNGRIANDITVDYYGQMQGRWLYDRATGHYLRFTDQMPHMDAADGEQLWADNLIVIEVEHQDRPDLFEPESRSASHQINLWGTGRAYLFRDGRYYEGYWERPCDFRTYPDATATPTPLPEAPPRDCYSNMGTALRILNPDGTPILMKPGRTWVMITRWMNYVTISEDTPDLAATAAILALTPTNTPWPTPIRATPTETPDS